MTNYDIFIKACKEAKIKCDEAYLSFLETKPDVYILNRTNEKIIHYLKKLGKAQYKIRIQNGNINNRSKKVIQAIIIAAILFIILSIAAFAFSPIRNYIIDRFAGNADISFITNNEDDFLIAKYAYIPKGYTVFSEKNGKNKQHIHLTGDDGDIFISSYKTEGSKFSFDIDKATTNEIIINNNVGYYSLTDRSIMLIWSTGNYSHVITADNSNSISLNDIIKIAESRKIIE